MSHRERWTVYPLLFLSLGMTFRDKIATTIEADLVRCRAIAVTNAEGVDVLRMEGDERGGRLEVLDEKGEPVAVFGGRGALVSHLRAESVVCGKLAVTNPPIILHSSEAGLDEPDAVPDR